MFFPKEYRTIVLGSLGVGKSTLTIQMLEKVFEENIDPTYEDERRMRYITPEGEDCLLSIMDTSLGVQYEGTTFEEIEGFLIRLLEKRGEKKIPMVLVGNKKDLGEEFRQVEREEGEEFAKKIQCPFFEVSGKTREGVEESFEALVREIEKRKYPKNYRQGKVERECMIQ